MPFEALTYEAQVEQTGLQEILDVLGDIDVQFTSREEYNQLGENVISREGEQGDYTLILPEDIRVEELPRIMREVNEMTFGTDFPIFSSSKELQYKIVIILEELEGKIGNGPEFIKAITEYSKFYEDITSPEEALLLQDNEYREGILAHAKNSEFQVFRDGVRESIVNHSKEQLSELRDELDSMLAGEIENHFEEAFMERGVNSLRQGLMTFTQLDNQKATGGERVDENTLDLEEQRLRDAIDIDSWKNRINQARSIGDTAAIESLELEFISKLHSELLKYQYQLTHEDLGFQPSKILESKELYCVGFSFVSHAFLQEIGIQHSVVNAPKGTLSDVSGHSAVVAHIGADDYLLDGAALNNIETIVSNKNEEDIENGQRYVSPDWINNTEDGLMASAYNNEGINNSGEVSIHLSEKSLENVPNDSDALYNRGNFLYEQGRYEEAINAYQQALKYNNTNPDIYKNLGVSYRELGLTETSSFYLLVARSIQGKNSVESFFDAINTGNWFNSNRQEINTHIENKDISSILVFLARIEKEEKISQQ